MKKAHMKYGAGFTAYRPWESFPEGMTLSSQGPNPLALIKHIVVFDMLIAPKWKVL